MKETEKKKSNKKKQVSHEKNNEQPPKKKLRKKKTMIVRYNNNNKKIERNLMENKKILNIRISKQKKIPIQTIYQIMIIIITSSS